MGIIFLFSVTLSENDRLLDNIYVYHSFFLFNGMMEIYTFFFNFLPKLLHFSFSNLALLTVSPFRIN